VGSGVILLNGGSSAGKSTLAEALRARLEVGWVVVGIDDWLAKIEERWWTPVDGGPPAFAFVPGDLPGSLVPLVAGPGDRLIDGYRRAVGALASAGVGVIVDEVCFDDGGWRRWEEVLDGVPVLRVAIRCDATIAEQRERRRGDRTPGLALGLAEAAHRSATYDVELDLGRATTAEAASVVIEAWAARRP
jgi:chloramphenicol 3-O phosphotransferase